MESNIRNLKKVIAIKQMFTKRQKDKKPRLEVHQYGINYVESKLETVREER